MKVIIIHSQKPGIMRTVTFSENKTLTNKMINSSNNYSYGNEVEYIIYGNSNEKIKNQRMELFLLSGMP